MGLKTYRSKRNFKTTPEPLAGSYMASETFSFCVQKHDARRLHYDFRLEHKGVLLSWAIPKGPSLNPNDKRLAIHVEDHPLDYQYFEGVIPQGNYGAGTVEIWDKGHYTVVNGSTRKQSEKILSEGLKKGHIAIVMYGEKLRGEFVLQKLKKDDEDTAWLLIKARDDYASENVVANTITPTAHKLVKMPKLIKPMLAHLVDQSFDDEDWLFEIKWDGYRALAFVDHHKVHLKSRTDHLWNPLFPLIVHDLEKIKGQAVFDGELVVLDAEGRASFQLMQNYQKERQEALYYYVFDLLFKDGVDLRALPLIERKEILRKLLKDLDLPFVRFSDHVIGKGGRLFKEASKLNLEEIIGKKIDSAYQSMRSHDWVKIKTSLRQEVVIGGFTEPRGSRKKFGALLIGVYNEQKELTYVGHVGGGFSSALLQSVYQQLEPLVQTKCPFKNTPKTNARAKWVKPVLVCEVSFTEWTKDNSMRHPIFQGLRIDKEAKKVKKELREPIPKTISADAKSNKLSLTHLDKIYWPKEKYTKGDLIEYYRHAAPFLLPYLKNRPIVLHRYPEGIESNSFYQKNQATHPKWIKTFPVIHGGKVDEYLLIDDIDSLLYAINLGSIDLHPFMSRCKTLENPDYCVIDLDPHGISFKMVIKAALTVHALLENLGVKHYCKTSGGKGLHILIPLKAKYTYEQSRQFAEILMHYVHKKLPRITSVERNPEKRQKKIYLDYLQNRTGQTIVAPYCVRPRPGALISTPLEWEELNAKLNPKNFTLKNMLNRLKQKGDIFKGILGPGINLKAALGRLSKEN